MNLICPSCQCNLEPLNIFTTTIDYCENGCKGLWFDKKEIIKLKDKLIKHENYLQIAGEYVKKSKADIDSESIKKCPVCNIDMKKVNKPKNTDVYIDLCDKCKGFWLDYGEIDAIYKHFNNNEITDFVFDEILTELLFGIIEGIIDGAIDSIADC